MRVKCLSVGFSNNNVAFFFICAFFFFFLKKGSQRYLQNVYFCTVVGVDVQTDTVKHLFGTHQCPYPLTFCVASLVLCHAFFVFST